MRHQTPFRRLSMSLSEPPSSDRSSAILPAPSRATTANRSAGALSGNSPVPAVRYEHIEVTPLTPSIGAVVTGKQLRSIDAATFEEIHAAWLRHLVLFFPDQALTPAEHLAFSERFGTPHVHPAAPYADDNPAIMVIHTDADSKRNNGGGWHTDVSADEQPPKATLVHLHQLPSQGGDTLFTNMYEVLATLSPALQAFLTRLNAEHVANYSGFYGDHAPQRASPKCIHPMVRTHPETGRNALYVNPGFTRRICELSDSESAALLKMLFEHATHPRFQCRYQWSRNALALWDNRCTWHQAVWDYYPETRSGLRVSIVGDRPTYRADAVGTDGKKAYQNGVKGVA